MNDNITVYEKPTCTKCREMDRFLKTVRTVAGKRDRMFGFGFDRPVEVFQTRGDRARRYRDYSAYLLERHIREMRRFLGVS